MTLFGHDEAIAAFAAAMQGDRLHHAWMLTGPRGVGKRTFADMAALRLLAEAAGPPPQGPGLEVASDHRIAKLIHAHSHPDYRCLTRPPKDKKERAKPLDERDPDAELARNIPIDSVRALQPLLGSTPSLSDRRVIVIDAIDDMERSAANALLKNLEEPPAKCVFLLVSHNPGRLLPTIRSRCRPLRFGPLDDQAMAAALRQAEPDLSPDDIAELIGTANGSPGKALEFAGLDIGDLERTIDDIVAYGDADGSKRSKLAQQLALKKAQPRYEAFLSRAPLAIARHARRQRGRALARSLDAWDEARHLAGSAGPLSLDPQSTVFTLAGMLASLHEPRP